MTNWAHWIVPIISVSIFGCGGSSTSLPPERPAGDISGVAHDGRIVDGDVRIYSYASGVKGDLLASSTTDENGAFSANFAASDQPVLIEVDGGHYIEEASDTLVRVKSGQGLLALSAYKSGQPLTVNVTPLTMLAVGLAQYKIANGDDVAKAIEASNTELLDIFSVRVTSTTPRDIRVPGEVTETVSESTLYGFLLASFSSYTAWLAEKNDGAFHEQFPSISLARLMYDDIRVDGILDGLSGLNDEGQPKQLTFAGAELNQNVYRSAIAQHMLVTASSPANKTGVTARNLEETATTFAANNASVFPGANPTSLDVKGPVIEPKDGVGSYYRGDIQYELDITDDSALRVVSFALDGVTLGDALDVNDPAIVIHTADFSDGEHTLDVTAFDDVGNLGTQSIVLLFDNTNPQFKVTSANITNQSRFTMTGTYEKGGSNITLFQVQGKNATVNGDATWSADVLLTPGNNDISILIRDDANNSTESKAIIAMDTVIPGFSGGDVVYSDEALFDLGNALCYVGKLRSVSQSSPLYVNKNKAAVSNSVPSQNYGWFDLHKARVPFIRFYVIDQSLQGGASTAASSIKVEMQYSVGGAVLAPYKAISIHDDPNTGLDPYFLIPLATEFLHPNWLTSSPQDEHKIAVRLTDEAANVRDFSFSFWVVFGDNDCTILQ